MQNDFVLLAPGSVVSAGLSGLWRRQDIRRIEIVLSSDANQSKQGVTSGVRKSRSHPVGWLLYLCWHRPAIAQTIRCLSATGLGPTPLGRLLRDVVVQTELPVPYGSTQRPARAAQYVRRSTDHQKCSTQNQTEVLAADAAGRGLIIVPAYSDESLSGLGIGWRNGLKELIADVQSERADFDCVLVYDVTGLAPDGVLYSGMTTKQVNAAFEQEMAVLPLTALLPLRQVTEREKSHPNTRA